MKKIIKKTKKSILEEEQPNKKNLTRALYKKAVGYSTQEVIEEYSVVDNEVTLSKRKLSTKSYPPIFLLFNLC